MNTMTRFGLGVNNSYMRVEDIFLSKDTMSFYVRKYVEPTKPYFEEVKLECAYALTGENPFIQAYVYAKLQPDFTDATDV